MTDTPPPDDASPYERVLWPILNSSPEATDEEARELHRVFICQRCRRVHPEAAPCDQGSSCENSEPILTGGPIDAQNIADKEEREHRRGAPIGNTNAVKHGYYARKLRETDADELKEFIFRGVREEALILRYFIRRVVELSTTQEDFGSAVSQLRAISLAITSLARLLRTERILADKEEEHPIAQAMDRILVQLAKDKRAERLNHKPTAVDPDPFQYTGPYEDLNPGQRADENDEEDEIDTPA
jgi:hypothetical protein